jgi:3-oxoacyl-[acyl-carrier protein] reductase
MTESKVVLITGASRGLGRQMALDCARYGLSVVVNYHSSGEAAEGVVRDIRAAGGRAIAIRADVSMEDDVRLLVDETLKQFGQIDCVINNAGVGRIVGVLDADSDLFDEAIRVNLRSAFLVSQAVIPHMISRSSGRLIFLSSLAAKTGGVISPAYAASKAGIEGLMHFYATYLMRYRITSNAIAPALFASDMVSAMKLPPLESLPLGRLGQPGELWPAVRMMLETEYLTGQTIQINAGRYMT